MNYNLLWFCLRSKKKKKDKKKNTTVWWWAQSEPFFWLTVAFKVNLISYLISVFEEQKESQTGKRLICSVGLSVE